MFGFVCVRVCANVCVRIINDDDSNSHNFIRQIYLIEKLNNLFPEPLKL